MLNVNIKYQSMSASEFQYKYFSGTSKLQVCMCSKLSILPVAPSWLLKHVILFASSFYSPAVVYISKVAELLAACQSSLSKCAWTKKPVMLPQIYLMLVWGLECTSQRLISQESHLGHISFLSQPTGCTLASDLLNANAKYSVTSTGRIQSANLLLLCCNSTLAA